MRTLLSNGTTVLVERMPQAKGVSVQLFAGIRGVRETPETHGYRHLLEHLILKGKDGKLDQRLEASGVFLQGRTFRDAMQIEFIGRAASLDLMLSSLDEVLSPVPATPATVAKEVEIMRHEFAQRGDSALLGQVAWQAAFGVSALDPFGDLEQMRAATPEQLVDLFNRHFAPANTVIVVSGAVDVNKLTERLRKQFQDREGPEVTFQAPRKGVPARQQTDLAFGEVRGALVSGLKEAGPALAAAYAIAARTETAYVTYTPSVGQGMVQVGRTDRNNALGEFIDGLAEGDEAALMPIGKLLAQRWLAGTLASPSGNGFIRGLLMAQNPGASPDELVKAISSTSWPEFHEAVGRFRKDRSVIAVGVRG